VLQSGGNRKRQRTRIRSLVARPFECSLMCLVFFECWAVDQCDVGCHFTALRIV